MSCLGGCGDIPQVLQLQGFRSGFDLPFCCPSSLPQVQCRSGLHGVVASGESRQSCVHSEKGAPCQCPSPFSWQAISSLRRQPQGPPSVEEASGAWVLLSSACGCQVAAPPMHAFAGHPGPFFRPPPQGESLNRPAWRKAFKDAPASAPRCRGSVALEPIISPLRMPVSTGSLCPAAESRTT